MKLSDNKDIVVRDKTGSYKLDVPSLPHVLVGEDGGELRDLDAEESGEAVFDASKLNGSEKESTLQPSIEASSIYRGLQLTGYSEFEAALVDMMIRHRNRQSSGEPDGK